MADNPSYTDQQAPGPFLRRKLEEGCTVIDLCVMGSDGAATRIDSWPASLGYDELRETIEERAARHAAVGPSAATFAVRAFDDRKELMGFDTFRVSASLALGRQALMSEPANEGGLVAQSMRHSEALVSMVVKNIAPMLHAQTAVIERLDKRAEAQDAASLKMFELLNDLDDRKAQREHESAKLAASLNMKKEAFSKVQGYVPLLLDAVMGKDPKGSKATSSILADELFQSVRPEQLQQLLGMLDADQRLKVLALFKRYLEQVDAEKPKEEKGAGDATH